MRRAHENYRLCPLCRSECREHGYGAAKCVSEVRITPDRDDEQASEREQLLAVSGLRRDMECRQTTRTSAARPLVIGEPTPAEPRVLSWRRPFEPPAPRGFLTMAFPPEEPRVAHSFPSANAPDPLEPRMSAL